MNINNLTDFRTALEQGKWAWPGGYPCYFICADGDPLSFEAVTENKALVEAAIADPGTDKQWQVVAYEINWEDESLLCAHTNQPIESAYGATV